jgi:hypothetical protein
MASFKNLHFQGLSLLKITQNFFMSTTLYHLFFKISGKQTQQCMSTVPATQEAEAGGLFEPTNLRPAWASYQDPISNKIRDNCLTMQGTPG